MLIRDEHPADAPAISAITTAAFATMPFSDGDEAELVERLRASGGLAVSLVAEEGGEVVGHIAFSPAWIGGEAGPWYQLAPVSVRPDLHRRGIGSALVRAGLDRLRALGAEACLVLGHAEYYPRFGFVSTPLVSDRYPEQNPNFMCLTLSGETPAGKVTYHPAFGEG
ncbi:GNAT family N-acetyltransferase [Parerythrobacter lacustris]|uniref:N-acetyltransferase n=1 Tax=Parerythrobacter lacustris TaxID=2969984 RepID=A0ABT1XPK8_9SPHN|nr:N-acetyltransferase [Parerythrobacter lacustris]MCR2833605.1 N-acetyltransferase [Parerythrobacter lacustris]